MILKLLDFMWSNYLSIREMLEIVVCM